MPLDFPASPVNGQIYTDTASGNKYTYNSTYGYWSYVPPSIPTGGGSDQIFFENGQTVLTTYNITSGKNAMTAGPVTVNNSVSVTIPDGSTWTIV